MTLIYSGRKVDKLEGSYRNPGFFNGVDPKASKVFTDDENIKSAYVSAGIEVKPIKVKRKPPPTDLLEEK